MTTSIRREIDSPTIQPLVETLIKRATDPKMSRIRDLWHQLHYLIRHSLVQKNPEAITLMGRVITMIKERDINEPLPRNEQRFYNYSLELIDEVAQKVDEECLETLKGIVFYDSEQSIDTSFDAYRIAIMKKQVIEREMLAMQKKIDALEQKVEMFTHMMPITKILIGAGNGTYTLPENVLADATQILLLCTACTDASRPHGEYYVTISNSENERYYFYYACFHGAHAWVFNSENMWLGISESRQIKVDGAEDHFRIFVIGYR